jgi:hypothetical protein
MAFYEGRGYCSLKNTDTGKVKEFSNKFELDGMEFLEPNVHFSALIILTEHVLPVKDTEK